MQSFHRNIWFKFSSCTSFHQHCHPRSCVLFALTFSFYYSSCHSCSFSFSSLLTRWSWQTSNTPLRVWTPTTSSPSPKVRSPRHMISTRLQSSPPCCSWTRWSSSRTKHLCGPWVRRFYIRGYAPSSTMSLSRSLNTSRFVSQSVVVNVRYNGATCWRWTGTTRWVPKLTQKHRVGHC